MKVAIRVFDEDERRYLETILDLAARRLKIAMEKTPTGVADVVFLKADEPGASLLINSSLVRKHPIVVIYGGSDHPWTLDKPATSRGLVELLSCIVAELKLTTGLPVPESPPAVVAHAHTAAEPAVSAGVAARGVRPLEAAVPAAVVAPGLVAAGAALAPFMPVHHGVQFMERMREIAAGSGIWLCRQDAHFAVAVNAALGKVYFPEDFADRVPDMARRCLAIGDAGITESGDAALHEWPLSSSAASMPLESFLWLVAQMAEPVLPDDVAELPDSSFRLQRWPSFSRILHSSGHIVMSGRLMKRAMRFVELAEATGESLENVVRFYNSACICGLLQVRPGEIQTGSGVAPLPMAEVPEVDAAQLQEIRKSKAGIFSRVLRRLLG